MPSEFYHCTSPETLLDILSEGRFASAGGLGEKPHTPDGLYAFGNRVVSSMSNYAKHGCQLEFQAACFALSIADSKKVKVVPEGVACRLKRSAYEVFGWTGYELVFNPRSCQIVGFRIKNAQAHRFVQAVRRTIAQTNDLIVAHIIHCAYSPAPLHLLRPCPDSCSTRPDPELAIKLCVYGMVVNVCVCVLTCNTNIACLHRI